MKQVRGSGAPDLFLSAGLLVVEQQLHSPNYLLADGVEQRVPHMHVVRQQELHHLQVLVLDGDEQRGAPQRVHAVHVDLEVDLGLPQRALHAAVVALLHGAQVRLLLRRQLRLGAHHAQTDAVAERRERAPSSAAAPAASAVVELRHRNRSARYHEHLRNEQKEDEEEEEKW